MDDAAMARLMAYQFPGNVRELENIVEQALVFAEGERITPAALPMFLSGERERERSGGINLRAFYLRRSLRIFPLYFAVLALYVVLVGAVERGSPAGHEFFKNLPYFATYTSNWFVALDGHEFFSQSASLL